MRDFSPVVERCAARAGTEAARLFHGRGRTYPGFDDITVDHYPPVLHIACFGNAEDEAVALADSLVKRLPDIQGVSVQLRQKRRSRWILTHGRVPEELPITEAGLRFTLRLRSNLNVGLFLDAAPARVWVREHAANRRVLNLFAYTCAFSVAAVAGGAASVVNVDMSGNALGWGARNHELNGHDTRNVHMIKADVFKAWGRLGRRGPYDLLVIDPPTHQAGSFNAEQQYGRIFKRLATLAAPGAEVLACLNSPFLHTDFLPAQMARWCPDCRFVEYLPTSPDFPDRSADGALKMAVFRRAG